MKSLRSALLLLAAMGFAAPCFAHHMAVVVSKQRSVSNLTSAQLGKIFRGEMKKWPNGTSIMLVLHRASPGEAATLQHLNKMSAEQLHAWMAENKDKDSVQLVDSDDDALSYVASTPGAIALIEIRSVKDNVKIVRIDGKVPMEAGYLPH